MVDPNSFNSITMRKLICSNLFNQIESLALQQDDVDPVLDHTMPSKEKIDKKLGKVTTTIFFKFFVWKVKFESYGSIEKDILDSHFSPYLQNLSFLNKN